MAGLLRKEPPQHPVKARYGPAGIEGILMSHNVFYGSNCSASNKTGGFGLFWVLLLVMGRETREETVRNSYSRCSRIRTENTTKYYDIKSKIEAGC